MRIAYYAEGGLPDEVGEYNRWKCVSNSTGWSRPATDEVLSEKILKKARKLPKYRKVEQIILLIVAERTQGSGMFDYAPGQTLLPNGGFSEVHLLIHPIAKSYRIA